MRKIVALLRAFICVLTSWFGGKCVKDGFTLIYYYNGE